MSTSDKEPMVLIQIPLLINYSCFISEEFNLLSTELFQVFSLLLLQENNIAEAKINNLVIY